MAYTNAQVMAALKALGAKVDALAPAKAAPAKAKVAQPTPFLTFIHEKAAAKIACEIHAPENCNRRFSPVSRGRTNHGAGIR